MSTRRWIVTGSSMVVEAETEAEAIDRAQDSSGWHWEALEDAAPTVGPLPGEGPADASEDPANYVTVRIRVCLACADSDCHTCYGGPCECGCRGECLTVDPHPGAGGLHEERVGAHVCEDAATREGIEWVCGRCGARWEAMG